MPRIIIRTMSGHSRECSSRNPEVLAPWLLETLTHFKVSRIDPVTVSAEPLWEWNLRTNDWTDSDWPPDASNSFYATGVAGATPAAAAADILARMSKWLDDHGSIR
jgi:hypothetical protein